MSAHNTAERNREAIRRAGEAAAEGLLPAPDGPALVVPSRSTPGRTYRVTAKGCGGAPAVHCTCQAHRTQPPAGSTPCWHTAAALIELALHDLVVFDGFCWWLTERAEGLVAE